MASEKPDDSLPDGAPAWVTPSLIADTIQFVRASTGHELKPAEAIEFIVSFSQLSDLLEPKASEEEQ